MASDTLFNTFSKNLTLVNPDYTDTFLCPLQVSPKCQKAYSRKDIHLLNKAHIWPSALGGVQVTITCRECNKFIGNNFEDHTIKDAKFRGRKRTFLKYPGIDGQVEVDLQISHSSDNEVKIEIHTLEATSNPSAIVARRELFKRGGPFPFTIEVRPHRKFNPTRATMTYLHTAYLHLFHNFGYEWFYTSVAQHLRKQLAEPDAGLFTSFQLVIEARNLNVTETAHFVVLAPKKLIGFAVISPALGFLEDKRVLTMISFHQPSIHYAQSQNVEGKLELSQNIVSTHEFLNDTENARNTSKIVLFRILNQYGIVENEQAFLSLVSGTYYTL